jgi:hypothetical protein
LHSVAKDVKTINQRIDRKILRRPLIETTKGVIRDGNELMKQFTV